VRIEGAVQRLGAEEDDAYFASRPRGHQIGAWASPQSRPIVRAELEARYAELERQHAGRPVPRPPFWGGFRIVPDRIELWDGRDNRLHERTLYLREGGSWRQDVLAHPVDRWRAPRSAIARAPAARGERIASRRALFPAWT
jgi:pyridoxamine 5'-phosphate oxidase